MVEDYTIVAWIICGARVEGLVGGVHFLKPISLFADVLHILSDTAGGFE